MVSVVLEDEGSRRLARRSKRPPLDDALVYVTVAVALLGAIELVLLAVGPVEPVWVISLFPVVAGVYLGMGVLAWARRPDSRVGALLTVGALTLLVAGLTNTGEPGLFAIGRPVPTVILAVVVHLLVSFPSGRLGRWSLRGLVIAGYVTTIVLEAPLYLFASVPPPYDVLQISDQAHLVHAGEWVQRCVGLAVVGATAAVLVGRLRDSKPRQRRVLVPLYAYGVVAVLLVPLTVIVLGPLFDWTGVTTFVIQVALLAFVPVAFGLSILRGGFARTAEVQVLGTWLGEAQASQPALRDALASTLGDPSLELWFWMPELDRYVDSTGGLVTAPLAEHGRGTVQIDVAGARAGAINYDSTLVDQAELVEAAGRVVAIAIDRDRLIADLRDKQEALLQSRRRIVDAGDRERRRIERNLHDGAQQRLMGLALALRLAEARVGEESAVHSLMTTAATELDGAMRDLRELARGLHPVLVSDAGLDGALESLAERSAIPVSLSVRLDGSVPEAIQVGAYYVIAEALTNAAKHSCAAQVHVRVRTDGSKLYLEVRDDGCGGAEIRPGSGLEGLHDRVDSLGGQLHLTSPLGGGTSVVAELPFA